MCDFVRRFRSAISNCAFTLCELTLAGEKSIKFTFQNRMRFQGAKASSLKTQFKTECVLRV
jgi:hypothetical protein